MDKIIDNAVLWEWYAINVTTIAIRPKLMDDTTPQVDINNQKLINVDDPINPKDGSNKRYIDNEIIKVKDLITKLVVWKTIGERIDDRTWSNFSPSLNALYRVFLISETSVPLQNGYKEVIFFTSASAIGTGTRRITTRKIGNSDTNLNMIYDNTKWTLKLDGGDTGGAIYKTYSVIKFNQLSIIIFVNFLVLLIIKVNIFLTNSLKINLYFKNKNC